MSAPPLARQTTYSSLPPSPRLVLETDKRRGLGILELEDKLARIGVDPEPDEEFWPARSRRGTIDESSRPELYMSPGQSERDLRSPSPESGPEATQTEPSLWDLLKDEAGAEGWEGWAVDGKWERIQNFLAVPFAVEQVRLSHVVADVGHAVWRTSLSRWIPLQLHDTPYPCFVRLASRPEMPCKRIVNLSHLAKSSSLSTSDAPDFHPYGDTVGRHRC